MSKTSIIIAAAVVALGSTVGMAHDKPTRFVRDGVTYEYTSAVHGQRQVIEGHRLPNGEPFHLVVSNGRVHGVSGGVPVSFVLARTTGSDVEVAAR